MDDNFSRSQFIYKTIVVKVGTNVITDQKGFLDIEIIKQIVSQILFLKNNGVRVILVTSGAVGAGKSVLKQKLQIQNKIITRQILASVGQVRLMNIYADIFKQQDYICSQLLVTKEDFRDRKHYLNLRNCLFGLLQTQVVPIINENDAISINTITFTDNDELAGLVAAMVNAEAVVILTSVDGLFTGDPLDLNSRIISEIQTADDSWQKFIFPVKTALGRGGMTTKCNVAKKNALLGINTHFVNGKKEGVLVKVMQGEKLGTKFIAEKHLSDRKKWLANNSGFEKGIIFIDNGAEKAVFDHSQAKSILPVGITKIQGDFEKGDIIKICNTKGELIGFGVAQYGAVLAQKYLGYKNKKPLIRYEYLFLSK